MIRRVRSIGDPTVPLTETYPRGVLFVGRERLTDQGLPERKIEGTGFFVRMGSGSVSHFYVVTAAHVVDGSAPSFVRVPLKDGSAHDLDVPEWISHRKHDVAVAPIRVLPMNHNLASTHVGQFIDDEQWAAGIPDWPQPFEMQLGDVVYFIGLLGKVEAMTKRNIPLVRTGTLGRLWQEDLPVRRGPHDATRYITAHLIDCRSFAGFSGSPCYIQRSVPNIIRRGIESFMATTYRTALLGLIGGHFDDWHPLRDREAYEYEQVGGGIGDNVEAPVSTGVGYVIPAEFIRETLMRKELIEMRQEADEAAAKQEDAATMDSVEAGEGEFERFEDLTRKLVNVPKKELDEKRKDES